MKRVIFIMPTMAHGNGVAMALIKLLEKLDSMKYDITVLLLSKEKGVSGDLPPHCKVLFAHRDGSKSFSRQYNKMFRWIKTICTVGKHSQFKGIRGISHWFGKFENTLFCKYVISLLSKERYDVAVGYNLGLPSSISVGLRANKKYVFYHDGRIQHYPDDRRYYRKADKIIAVSEGVRQELHEKLKLPLGKIEVIHNIFNFDEIAAGANKPCDCEDINGKCSLTITTVAHISYEKGIKEAIHTAALIKKSVPDFQWCFVGPFSEGDHYYIECCNLINELDLKNNVSLIGLRKNPFPYMQLCDIYVQPSQFEALGNTIVEAQFLGKVVISTKTAGGLELIEDEVNGLLCDMTPESIAQTVIRLYEDKALYGYLQSNIQKAELNNEESLRKIENLLGA